MSEPDADEHAQDAPDDDAFDHEFDSPFAHVPAADAGPLPFQDGYWTYEKTFQAMGTSGAGSRRGLRGVALVVVWVLLAGALFGLLLALLR